MTRLDAALEEFEATEANLAKLNALWERIERLLPTGPSFGSPPGYDELLLAFRRILPALPAIDGFQVEDHLCEFDVAGQLLLEALEGGEVVAEVEARNTLSEQGRQLREYSFRLQSARRHLVRGRILVLVDEFGQLIGELWPQHEGLAHDTNITAPSWDRLKEIVAEVDTLLGAGSRPARWSALNRHLAFGMMQDLSDIVQMDWPEVSRSIRAQSYDKYDPIPVVAEDLGDIVAAGPGGSATTQLAWSVLTDEDFERLVFSLISEAPGYENPQWLQKIRAPDRGRDLSVVRVDGDPLAGVRRYRTIIQCKHWLSTSVNSDHVGRARDQMDSWSPPRVDVLVIATTGRFTVDAVTLVERHNQGDRALRIQMWPDSHLERLLAARPHLIGEFRLRRKD